MKTAVHLIIILFICAPILLIAQDYDEVTYKFGKFEGELPSGKKFYVTGSLINMDHAPANVVILNIYELEHKSNKKKDECPYYNGYYWKPEDANSQQFQIFVDHPLFFSRNYKFEFIYFSSASSTGGTKILASFIKRLDQHFSDSKSLSTGDMRDILKEVNNELTGDNFGKLGFAPDGRCINRSTFQFQKGNIEVLKFPIETEKGDVSEEQLAIMISDKYLVKSGEKKIERYKDTLQYYINKASSDALIGNLQKLLAANRSEVQFSQGQLNDLKAVLQEKDWSKNPFPAFEHLYDGNLINEPNKINLADLDNACENLRKEQKLLEDSKAAVANAESQLGTFEEIVLQGYEKTGTSISYNTIAHDQPVETDASKATTPAGMSGAFLNPASRGGPSEMDAFGNAAIRSYFKPVDKRLPGKLAYVNHGWPLNRMSATFGITVSPISYQGQDLESAIGVKPVFALGYDVTRDFSIDIGGVLFRQNNSDLLVDDKKIKFAPVLSIQFDANLFNRFKALGTGEKYKLGINQ